MTPTEQSLLDSVCRDPADDLPRLVYADWLDENGESERAEFIRLQIAGEYAEPLPKWVEPMMKAIGISTVGADPDGGSFDDFGTAACYRNGETVMSYEWSRGFVSSVSLSMSAFLGTRCELCETMRDRPYHERAIIPPVSPLWFTTDIGPDIQTFKTERCDGKGRFPGLASTIAKRWPVKRITLVGLNSATMTTRPRGDWSVTYDGVPYPEFDKYYLAARESVGTGKVEEVFSAAAVDYARANASLPPLNRVTRPPVG